MLVTSLASFALIYVVVYYILKMFIINKIKPIFKTMQNIELNELDLSDSLDDVDIIAAAEREVERWANKKSNEVAQLKHLEKYRKEFIGNVFHELKTPIFNIQGYISTLLDGGSEDETINRRFLEKAEKSIDRMISIVDDLNSISNLESGQLEIHISEFDISELINEVIDLQEGRANKKNIKLVNEASGILVNADKKLIMQVLTNLITNSINYGKSGGQTTMKIDKMYKKILVEVSDNGIGIKETHLSRLFERFYRVDQSRSKESGGTGLGLAICKHIIEAHKQSIYVRSTVDVGTTFSFTLS
jgi:two-component system phosphate regulon sensor histidine kinase PhoR